MRNTVVVVTISVLATLTLDHLIVAPRLHAQEVAVLSMNGRWSGLAIDSSGLLTMMWNSTQSDAEAFKGITEFRNNDSGTVLSDGLLSGTIKERTLDFTITFSKGSSITMRNGKVQPLNCDLTLRGVATITSDHIEGTYAAKSCTASIPGGKFTLTRHADGSPAATVATPPPPDKNWKNKLQQELRDAFGITDQGRLDRNQVTRAGSVYVVQQSGITAERVNLDRVYRTFVTNGILRQAGGGAKLLGEIFNNESREASRTFNKGDRVYVVGIAIEDNKNLVLNLLSLDVSSVTVNGTTSQTRYKAGLEFEFAKGFLPLTDVQTLKTLIDPFLKSEADASAPRSLELGQTIEQVEAILGKPETIVKLGEKVIYAYKAMKVIFINGKVADVQ